MRVLMWEAKGDADGLIAWWRAQVEPQLPDGASAELFRSADRVVALVRFSGERMTVPDPPEELTARPPHAWPFETVPIESAPFESTPIESAPLEGAPSETGD